MHPDCPQVVSFEAVFEPDPPGTPASPRVRRLGQSETGGDALFVSFEERAILEPPDTPAAARPREVPPSTDEEAVAAELADRLLAFARAHPTGLTAAQMADLVRRLIERRAG